MQCKKNEIKLSFKTHCNAKNILKISDKAMKNNEQNENSDTTISQHINKRIQYFTYRKNTAFENNVFKNI